MRFDELPEDDARALLLRCLSAPGWAASSIPRMPRIATCATSARSSAHSWFALSMWTLASGERRVR